MTTKQKKTKRKTLFAVFDVDNGYFEEIAVGVQHFGQIPGGVQPLPRTPSGSAYVTAIGPSPVVNGNIFSGFNYSMFATPT